jgi:hypothetical protein
MLVFKQVITFLKACCWHFCFKKLQILFNIIKLVEPSWGTETLAEWRQSDTKKSPSDHDLSPTMQIRSSQ